MKGVKEWSTLVGDVYEATREVGLPDDVDDENAAFFQRFKMF